MRHVYEAAERTAKAMQNFGRVLSVGVTFKSTTNPREKSISIAPGGGDKNGAYIKIVYSRSSGMRFQDCYLSHEDARELAYTLLGWVDDEPQPPQSVVVAYGESENTEALPPSGVVVYPDGASSEKLRRGDEVRILTGDKVFKRRFGDNPIGTVRYCDNGWVILGAVNRWGKRVTVRRRIENVRKLT